MYYSPKKTVRLGDAFVSGYDNTTASFVQTLDPYENHGSVEATLVVNVSGGGANIGDSNRQCGIRVRTSNGQNDCALDIMGRIKVSGKKGYSGGVGVQHVWDPNVSRFRKGDIIFEDGICVGYNCHD